MCTTVFLCMNVRVKEFDSAVTLIVLCCLFSLIFVF